MISVDATAFIIMGLVFALVLVLKSLFFEPLAQAQETRERRIETADNAWGDAQRTIREASSRVQAAVAAARNEGYTLLDRARSEAQARARAQIDQHREEAQSRIAQSRATLREEADRAVRELEGQADRLAAAIASRILGRNVA